jgi:hypothetical protein
MNNKKKKNHHDQREQGGKRGRMYESKRSSVTEDKVRWGLKISPSSKIALEMEDLSTYIAQQS